VGQVVGECDGDGSRTGADVEYSERRFVVEFAEDCFDEVFRLWAGDEDGWGDVEGEAVELLLAGDVLDGLVDEAAGDCGFVGGLFGGGESAAGIGVKLGACDVERVQEQDERVAGGVGAEVGGRVELGGGAGEGFAEGVVSCQWSVLRFRITAVSGQLSATGMRLEG